jgi:hypothetical protein
MTPRASFVAAREALVAVCAQLVGELVAAETFLRRPAQGLD